MMTSEEERVLYTTIYPFMSRALGLSGLEKECFAIIFSFWLNNEKQAVKVSLTVMQTITGGSRRGLILALHRLTDKGYVTATRRTGKRTIYSVCIDQEQLEKFEAAYRQSPEKRLHHRWCTDYTGTGEQTAQTGELIAPYNKKINKNKNNINNNAIRMRVKKITESDIGCLTLLKKEPATGELM